MTIPSCLKWAHEITERAMNKGPRYAVDATIGNGHDTLHLARISRLDGKVWGFDIQDKAIEQTRTRLAEERLEDQVTLIKACHTDMKQHLPDEHIGRISAVMFNLGYLPKGDHSVITRTETTIPALETALDLVRIGGVVTIVMYPGHEKNETEDVLEWAEKLDKEKIVVLWYRFMNYPDNAPSLLCLERRK